MRIFGLVLGDFGFSLAFVGGDLGGEEFGFLFRDSGEERLGQVFEEVFDLVAVEGEHMLKA